MGKINRLFKISVEHEFFPENICRDLNFVPTTKSEVYLEKIGLLLKNEINGVSVFYDEDKLDILQLYADDAGEPLFFCFKVFSDNQHFYNFTDPLPYRNNAILYFENSQSEQNNLSKQDQVSGEDFLDIDSSSIKENLTSADISVRPAFIVGIFVSAKLGNLPDKDGPIAPLQYSINFKARETFWKYYIFGNQSRNEIFIADATNKITFERLGPSSFPKVGDALTFRTKTPIPMRQRPDFRFQLCEKGSGGTNILLKRLPVASEQRIVKEIIGGKEESVSELYVTL